MTFRLKYNTYALLGNMARLNIRHIFHLKLQSVDLIFTDPPYNQESLYLYGERAKIASRVLKEGGSLVTFQCNYYLPQVLDQFKSTGSKLLVANMCKL